MRSLFTSLISAAPIAIIELDGCICLCAGILDSVYAGTGK